MEGVFPPRESLGPTALRRLEGDFNKRARIFYIFVLGFEAGGHQGICQKYPHCFQYVTRTPVRASGVGAYREWYMDCPIEIPTASSAVSFVAVACRYSARRSSVS